MDDVMKLIYPCILNEGFSSKFSSYQLQHTYEEDQKAQQPKCCGYNNHKDKDTHPLEYTMTSGRTCDSMAYFNKLIKVFGDYCMQ